MRRGPSARARVRPIADRAGVRLRCPAGRRACIGARWRATMCLLSPAGHRATCDLRHARHRDARGGEPTGRLARRHRGTSDAGRCAGRTMPSFVLKADRAERWRRRGVRIALSVVALLGAIGLVGPGWRTPSATALPLHHPTWRPMLQQACASLGCRVGEYRQIDALSVESSALVRVEGAPVYRLAVTLRNRAAHWMWPRRRSICR